MRNYPRIASYDPRGFDVGDLEQELWITWMNATRTYDPEKGASFKTYLHRGMQLAVARFIQTRIRRNGENFARSFQEEVADGEQLSEVVADESAVDPEDMMIRAETFQKALKRMSSDTRAIVEVFEAQPAALLDQVALVEEKADHAQRIGVPYAAARGLRLRTLMDLAGLSARERTAVMNEIKAIAQTTAG